jgi:hypothetical protein
VLALIVSGFEFPDDLHELVEHQTWARLVPNGHARVQHHIYLAGEIYMCGTQVHVRLSTNAPAAMGPATMDCRKNPFRESSS